MLRLSKEDEDLRQKAKQYLKREDCRGGYDRPGGWRYAGEELGRVIAKRMGLDLSGFIDHKDTDRDNNTRENLRSATNRENQGNSRIRRDNTSGFKGVGFHKTKGKWRARIRDHGKRRCLGYFDSPEEAADAYSEAHRKIFGEFFRI